MDQLRLRRGEVDDAAGISALHVRETMRSCDPKWVAGHLRDYPSVVAHDGGRLVGFAYASQFAPDILEILNILVASDYRGKGIGSRLIRAIEESTAGCFGAILLVNSMLYTGPPDKRPATAFYRRLGYNCVLSTDSSNLFAKVLNGASADRARPAAP